MLLGLRAAQHPAGHLTPGEPDLDPHPRLGVVGHALRHQVLEHPVEVPRGDIDAHLGHRLVGCDR